MLHDKLGLYMHDVDMYLRKWPYGYVTYKNFVFCVLTWLWSIFLGGWV